MKKRVALNLWSSTSARLLSALLLVAPCAVGLAACGDEEGDKPGTWQDAGELCGNGAIDEGEVCDGAALPGNAPEGATCKADCSGWSVPAAAACGNGVIDEGEECDGAQMPAGAHENARCASDCTIVKCGNGVIDEGEACDPNAALPDGAREGSVCLDTCEIRGPDCGDGVIDPAKGEECEFDPENDNAPLVLPPYKPEQCLPNCTLKICGNNRIDGDEQCDFDKEGGNQPVFPPGVTVLEGSICTGSCEIDQCLENDNKTEPEPICGCHELTDDIDTDNDGTPDCIDACPTDKRIQTESQKNGCQCGETKRGNDCYRNIDTLQDFIDYRDAWNSVKSTTPNAILYSDIAFDGSQPLLGSKHIEWQGFVNYRGIFDGNGNTISVQVESSFDGLGCRRSPCGLFASTKNATIKNLKVDLSMVISLSGANPSVDAGLLVGAMSSGTLENVHVRGTLSFPSSDETSSPYDLFLGGLVGRVENGTIFDASSTGSVVLNQPPTNSFVGGLIGQTNGTTYNVWSSSDVRQWTPKRAYLGGLIGRMMGNAGLLNA